MEDENLKVLVKEFALQINPADIIKCIDENKIDYLKYLLNRIKSREILNTEEMSNE